MIILLTFCTHILHLLWSNMQPQFPDQNYEILNAHIVQFMLSAHGSLAVTQVMPSEGESYTFLSF